MDSYNKFDEKTQPPIEKFDSQLNLSSITKNDHEHRLKVWNAFKIKDLGTYHDLYVKTDSLLLADAFENFRKTCIEIYQLDPARVVSALGLAWQACLKIAKIKL